MAPPKMR